MTDESNIGVWLWVVLLVDINVTWIGMDLWLRSHGHEFLTTEFREGLANPLIGPFLFGFTLLTFGAFFWHMYISKG